MVVTDLITPDRVMCGKGFTSKKRLLEQLSILLAESAQAVSQGEIFESLFNRERLGSTGLGKGVAIPHGRISGLTQPVCAFVKLDDPVAFDSPANQPVDLLFALLVPEDSTEEHLHLLANIAEMFSNPEICDGLRNCTDVNSIINLLGRWESRRISA